MQVDEFIRQAKPTKWVVEERIAAGALTVIAGQAKKARKTLLLLHLVEQVAQGEPWLDHVTLKRPVIFVGFEGGGSFLAQRVLDVGHKAALLPDEEHIPASFSAGLAGYNWVMDRLAQAARTKEPWPVLVCIDTLSQVLAACGVEENDNMAVTKFLAPHEELVQAAGAAMVFSHHFAKSNFQMRGASAISALCNWCEINMIAGEAGLLKLEWSLRHGIGGLDGIRVEKPNGKFTFTTVDARSLPLGECAERRERTQETRRIIVEFLRSKTGQDVSYDEIAAAVKKGAGLKRTPSVRHQIEPACLALKAELGLKAAIGMGVAGVHVSDQQPHLH